MKRWLIVAFCLRLLFAVAFYGNSDQQAYDEVASIMRNGGNVYAETTRYNYAPIWFHVIHIGDMVSEAASVPLHTVLRGFLSMIDLANALLIGAIVQQWGRGGAQGAARLYAFNPGVIFIVSYHGQFETLALLPALGAIYLALRHSRAHFETR